MKILECSSKGDKRFSALYAKVSVFGVYDSIENHYQKSKVFEVIETGEYVTFDSFRKVKAAQYRTKEFRLKGFLFNNKLLPIQYLTIWYKSLWAKYLESNKYLIDVIYQYDSFVDSYAKNNTVNDQASIIKEFRYNEPEKLYMQIMNEAKKCFGENAILSKEIIIR